MKQAGWQESDVTCKQAVFSIMLIAGCGRQRLEIFSGKYEYALVVQSYMIRTGRIMRAASYHKKAQAEQSMHVDKCHNCGWNHKYCQQDQVSNHPFQQPSDADLLLVWPLLLLLSPRCVHGLFGDVGFPPGCSFFDCFGRPGLRNEKLFGFPPGCSLSIVSVDLDCESKAVRLPS